MSLEVLLNTYGHHHPDYLSDAVEKITMREPTGERKAHVSGAVSGAVLPLRQIAPDKPLISLVGPAGLEPATRPL
jgi:hypothetical protein